MVSINHVDGIQVIGGIDRFRTPRLSAIDGMQYHPLTSNYRSLVAVEKENVFEEIFETARLNLPISPPIIGMKN